MFLGRTFRIVVELVLLLAVEAKKGVADCNSSSSVENNNKMASEWRDLPHIMQTQHGKDSSLLQHMQTNLLGES